MACSPPRATREIPAGAFLLYLQLHGDPDDLRAVLREHPVETALRTLELCTSGLMTDATRYHALITQREQGIPSATPQGVHDG